MSDSVHALYIVHSWIEQKFPGASIVLIRNDEGVSWSIHVQGATSSFGISVDQSALARPDFVCAVLDDNGPAMFTDAPVLPATFHVTTDGLSIRDPLQPH